MTDICSSNSRASQAVESENLQEVTSDILGDFLSVEIPMPTPDTSAVLRLFYESLGERFDNSISATGFSNFIEGITEIAIAEVIACSSSEVLNVSQLASDFADAVSQTLMSDETLREVRIILGEILCAESMEQRSLTAMECPSRGDCTCPPDGINADIMCTCEFFACLDVEDHLGPIFGFSSLVQGPCLAFVVDTTGSMSAEIAAISRVIEEFLRSEEAVNELRCYILVPFNDRGGVVSDSKLCFMIIIMVIPIEQQ